MIIETKYNIGEEVWYKGYKELFCDKVFNIEVIVDNKGEIIVEYDLWGDVIKHECQLFPHQRRIVKKFVEFCNSKIISYICILKVQLRLNNKNIITL